MVNYIDWNESHKCKNEIDIKLKSPKSTWMKQTLKQILEKDVMKNNKWNTLKQKKQMQNLELNCSVSPKVSCKGDFMFLVILTWCFWCSIQICLNLYCKICLCCSTSFYIFFCLSFWFFSFQCWFLNFNCFSFRPSNFFSLSFLMFWAPISSFLQSVLYH